MGGCGCGCVHVYIHAHVCVTVIIFSIQALMTIPGCNYVRVGVGALVCKALQYWGGEVAILLVALLVLKSTLSREHCSISTASGQYLAFQGNCANNNGSYHFSYYTLLCYDTADFNKVLYE